MSSILKALYDIQGYVVVPGLIADEDHADLVSACRLQDAPWRREMVHLSKACRGGKGALGLSRGRSADG